MTYLPKTTAFFRPLALSLRHRRALTPEEQAERRMRRRLLQFIVETHRRREAERRGLHNATGGRSA